MSLIKGAKMSKFKINTLTPNFMAKSVNETISFYEDNFHFKVVMTVPENKKSDLNWAMMTNGKVNLMFQKKENLIEEYPVLANSASGGGLTFFIEVEHVEDLYNQLKAKVKIVKELGETFYGTKEFAIVDCNNYILTLAEPKS